MNKIYVGWNEGEFGSGGYLDKVSTDKLKMVKQCLEVQHDQNMDIVVFDLDTMEKLFECDCLHQFSDKSWCRCPDCKDNDETVRYLSETKQGNYSK